VVFKNKIKYFLGWTSVASRSVGLNKDYPFLSILLLFSSTCAGVTNEKMFLVHTPIHPSCMGSVLVGAGAL